MTGPCETERRSESDNGTSRATRTIQVAAAEAGGGLDVVGSGTGRRNGDIVGDSFGMGENATRENEVGVENVWIAAMWYPPPGI